ncbi:MAG: hypothetical protein ACRDIU_02125, partial [Actinomycetota bacterium]
MGYAEVVLNETGHGVAFASERASQSSGFERPLTLIVTTDDFGESWKPSLTIEAVTRDVQIVNDNLYAVTGAGLFQKYSLRGEWKLTSKRPDLCRLALLDDRQGFVASTTGELLVTRNSGRSFRRVLPAGNARDISFR